MKKQNTEKYRTIPKQVYQTFSLCDQWYAPTDIIKLTQDLGDVPTKTSGKIQYINMPFAFDTETTSFLDAHGNKCGTVYCWTFGMNGRVIFGRTYSQFILCMQKLSDMLMLGPQRRIIVYVHNLAFDFQFIRHLFHWEKIFSLDVRKPLYALSDLGIEFRCSYLLTGYNLETVGKHLTRYPVKKMVGDLDYSLIRHCRTPMTETEIRYAVYDVLVVMAHIQERIEIEGGIHKIPLTKTGYVRKRCRNACLYDGSHKKNQKKYTEYMSLMHSLTIEPDEYKQMKQAFQGGFTHANAWKALQVWEHVESFDFTSSYPAVMVCEKFPMSGGEKIEITSKEQFEHNLSLYCCIFDIQIEGLEGIESIEHPLSISKCRCVKNPLVNNGRLVNADSLITTVTDVDFTVLQKFYKWDRIGVRNFRRYKRGYLPTALVDAILTMYENKTKLKGVKGSEVEYQASKGDVNSAYGMMVTDICREIINYLYEENEWGVSEEPDIAEALNRYNNNKRRFLFYGWGLFVTAYARRNLFTGILEFGSDYIYSDTDSIKAIHAENHRTYIETYDKFIHYKMVKAMKFHGFPEDRWIPKTIKGVEKPLGYWDDEGEYQAFKTLGAKRYMTMQNNEFTITVSGLNKTVAVPYMLRKFVFYKLADDVLKGHRKAPRAQDLMFQAFADSLYIPPEYTGKKCHTYIDEPMTGTLIDYLGNEGTYAEQSCIHLGAADYSLSLSRIYVDFMCRIKQIEE